MSVINCYRCFKVATCLGYDTIQADRQFRRFSKILTVMLEVVDSFERLVLNQKSTRRHIANDRNLIFLFSGPWLGACQGILHRQCTPKIYSGERQKSEDDGSYHPHAWASRWELQREMCFFSIDIRSNDSNVDCLLDAANIKTYIVCNLFKYYYRESGFNQAIKQRTVLWKYFRTP